MCLNLLSAHLLRFRLRARGKKLAIGLAIASVGVFLTCLVVLSGHNAEGFQGQPPFQWQTLWMGVKIGLSVVAVGLVGYALATPTRSDTERHVHWICGGMGVGLLLLAGWLWVTGDRSYLGDSGMRVLWQLILGLGASLVLLLGAIPLFGRRAGIVVLHAGVGLLMFGQWFVSNYDVEEQITMAEGQTVHFAQDIRNVELAVIDRENSAAGGQDDVVAIPLTRNGKATRLLESKRIEDEQLPFDIEVVQFMGNAQVDPLPAGQSTPVTLGNGLRFQAVERRGAAGASSSQVDLAAGYFRFVDKDSGGLLGTVLLAQDQLMMRGGQLVRFDAEQIAVDGQSFDVQLRFARSYKDYSLRLIDVRKDDYLGTSIPRNYSSRVELIDPKRDVQQELNIWMNNPRRYAGETFYQSGWRLDPLTKKEYSTLQVVRNQGWMIPYVACMVGMVGMLAHFSLVLLRFLNRQTSKPAGDADTKLSVKSRPRSQTGSRQSGRWANWLVPACVVAGAVILLVRVATPPKAANDEFQLEQFGELPLVYQGRVKPFDTLARNSLRVISDAETFRGLLPIEEWEREWPKIESQLKARWPELANKDLSAYQKGDLLGLIEFVEQETKADTYEVSKVVEELTCRRQPATRWLLDVITASDRARQHRVVRIYNLQVLDLLGLSRRPGFRYSLAEITPRMEQFEQQVLQADRLQRENVEELDLYQKKLLSVDQKLRTIMMLYRAFSPPDLPPLPSADEFESDHTQAMEKMEVFRQAVAKASERLRMSPLPLAVPPEDPDDPWQAYSAAWPAQFLATQVLKQKPAACFGFLNEIFFSYSHQDPKTFNNAVAAYQRQLRNEPPTELQTSQSVTGGVISRFFGSFYAFEAYFNHAAPFFWCSVLYLLAFMLLSVGWLVGRVPLYRAANSLIGLTFLLHTLALVARIYISGRPPVTNLYSSAVFIGWGAVGLALILEYFFRNGVASVIAAVSGFATLLIAHKLAGDGDTFQVLQAVLDTQFWLATHVVCITFGYATTFLAGGLGLLFILRGVFTPTLNSRAAHELGRMMYGTLCFSILFSFVGTILGGLWADDSWGRFWGWDPKENGALIIVLWNALILHARWDGMIRARGMAVLSVLGNVVTAWSWFGVNELGVGLHSYGFTEGRLLTLALVILAHFVAILIGWLPVSLWWSERGADRSLASRSTLTGDA